MKLLLVGEAPAKSGPPTPLEGASARLLAGLVGIEVDQLLEQTERMNLLNYWPGSDGKGGSAFPIAAGRAGFYAMLHRFGGRRVIFMGRAADAALPDHQPYFQWELQQHGATKFTAARFPHPSGLNRLWNQREIREKAGAFLRQALADCQP